MMRKVKNNIKAVSTIVGVILLISMVITALASVQVWLNSEASEVIDTAEDAFDGYMGEREGEISDGDDDDYDNPPSEVYDYIDSDDGENNNSPPEEHKPTLSYGDPEFFNSVFHMSIAVIDDERIVIAYTDGSTELGTVRLGTISGDTIYFGEPTVFFDVPTRYEYDFSVISLGNDKILVLYRDFINSGYGTARVGIISGDTISFGEPAVFNAATTLYISAVAINAEEQCYDEGVMVFFTNIDVFPPDGVAVFGVISGDDILFDEFGGPVIFDNGDIIGFSARVSSQYWGDDRIILSYYNNGDGIVRLVDTSGDTISFSDEYEFEFYDELKPCVPQLTVLDSEHVLVTYSNSTGVPYHNNYGKGKILTIENDDVTFGDAISIVSEYNTTDITSATLDSEHIVISYKTNAEGIAVLGALSGNYELYLDDPIILENNCPPDALLPSWIFTSSLGSERVVTLYKDNNGGTSGRGNAYVVIGTYS